MIKKVLGAAGALTLVLIPVFVTFYLSRSAPDVRYTLSETIPISPLDPTAKLSESVQQLVVRNVGNAEATKIVVKMNASVIPYSIRKYSSADLVQFYTQTVPFELVYPQLPPQAGFTLFFKSPGNGVQQGDLSVSHNGGIAVEALSKSQDPIAKAAPWIFYGVAAAIWILISGNSL